MSFPRDRRAAFLAAAAASVMGALCLPGPAHAASRSVGDVPDPMYQTNGHVDAVLSVGDTIYIGGTFTSVRPAGAPAGTNEVSRTRLAAFSRSTGALLAWNPGVGHQVNALAASPDGRTIYVGGRFHRLGGKPRNNIGAVRASTGHVTSFRANANRRVSAIATSGHVVYLAGHFTHVAGKARYSMAAVRSNGHLLRFGSCRTTGAALSIAVTGKGKKVYVGGGFTRVCGHKSRHLALMSSAGRLRPLKSHPSYPVTGLVASAGRVYVSGTGPGGHVGSYTAKGARRWVVQTDGNVQALAVIGSNVYAGGNFDHVCASNTGGPDGGFDCRKNLATRHKVVALGTYRGTLRAWAPNPNSSLGVTAMARSASSLLVGGWFTVVHGQPCQGFARFSRA